MRTRGLGEGIMGCQAKADELAHYILKKRLMKLITFSNLKLSVPFFPEPSVGCGFPGAPAHSTVEFSTQSVGPGTVARYSCDRGFELLGPARRICNSNGTWVPQGIPFCGKLQKNLK